MAYFYVDDSVHDEAGFIIGACVYSKDDLTESISAILSQYSYDPNHSEFKSSINYKKEPNMAHVRNGLRELFHKKCRFGLVIIPRKERKNLGLECIKGIFGFIKHNNLKEPINIYFDQGLFPSLQQAHAAVANNSLEGSTFHFEQDSVHVKGLQLADLNAHTASVILKEKMGLIKKMVKAGEDSGYDPDSEMELGFEMWASLRYNLFHERPKIAIDDPIEDFTFNVEPYGLYIANSCGAELASYSKESFGKVYLGCIH